VINIDFAKNLHKNEISLKKFPHFLRIINQSQNLPADSFQSSNHHAFSTFSSEAIIFVCNRGLASPHHAQK
jgi:hypothetical protein